jgi:hypothetical protein
MQFSGFGPVREPGTYAASPMVQPGFFPTGTHDSAMEGQFSEKIGCGVRTSCADGIPIFRFPPMGYE